MKPGTILINERLFCIEELQIIMLTVFGFTCEKMMAFTRFEKWQIKNWRTSSQQKMGVETSPELAYIAQANGFTRSGLFNNEPLFNKGQRQKLKAMAHYLQLADAGAIHPEVLPA